MNKMVEEGDIRKERDSLATWDKYLCNTPKQISIR